MNSLLDVAFSPFDVIFYTLSDTFTLIIFFVIALLIASIITIAIVLNKNKKSGSDKSTKGHSDACNKDPWSK